MKKILAITLLLATALSGCQKGAEQPKGGGDSLSRVSGVARRPAEGATILLYRPGDDLRGPPFSSIGPLGPDGSYAIDLPAGNYFFIIRQRQNGEESGPVKEGDVKSDPLAVTVEPGKPLNLDLNAYVKSGNAKESFGAPAQWKTSVNGRITDPDGKPVEGIRVHAYTHVQMSERPKFVSARTGPDGKYTLPMPEGGTFYLCARDKYGGPPKVGDLYGRYDHGTVESSGVTVAEGQVMDNVDIVVHTVW